MRKQNSPFTRILAMVLLTAVSGVVSAQGALITIGTGTVNGQVHNLIYDPDSPLGPVTYLDYRTYDSRGENLVNWARYLAVSAIQLNPGVSAAFSFSTGWRLPSVGNNPQVGWNQTSSELGHLYYSELGNVAGAGWANMGPFTSLPTDAWIENGYWCQDKYNGSYYWGFADNGLQTWDKSAYGWYWYDDGWGMAVHPGAVVVPEATTTLAGAGGLFAVLLLHALRASRAGKSAA